MPVQFQHLGISITEKSDIGEFYQEILGLQIQREFTLKSVLVRQIFRLEREIKVIAGTIGTLNIELFLVENNPGFTCEHICFVTENRPALMKNCRAKDYPMTIIERKPSDIVFVRDRSGNLFEIKEA